MIMDSTPAEISGVGTFLSSRRRLGTQRPAACAVYRFAWRLGARSLMLTGVPLLTCRASSRASQLVSLMQPWELRLLTASGSGVP